MFQIMNRNDILNSANGARFYMRHYAMGYYPVARLERIALPVNRMFFPLRNPNGSSNFIRDAERVYELKENHLYFIPAFYPANVHLDDDLFFLSIQNNLEIFPGTELFSGCSRMLEIPYPEELPELIELFDIPPDELSFGSLRFQSIVFSLLVSLIAKFPKEDFQKTLSLRRYSVLIDYMQARGNAETRVTDLAEIMKESREGFTRHFSTKTGITPKQFIDRFLTGKSLELLNGDSSVKEIAYGLKFSNEFVFSRYFKTHVGMSPLAWRKRRIS